MHHLKLLLEPKCPKRVNEVLGKDEDAWYAYHRMRGYHTEDYHQLKGEIEILIQRGRLLSYMKDVEGATRKRSHSQREQNSENLSAKKEKITEEVPETRVARLTLNTISGGFTGGGETSSSKKRYALSLMHVSHNIFSGKEERLVAVGFSRRDSEGVIAHENDPMVIKV